MPKFALRIKADLENVKSMSWDANNQWCVIVQNVQTQDTCEAYFSREVRTRFEFHWRAAASCRWYLAFTRFYLAT